MDFDPLRRALEPGLRRLLHAYWRFARGLTLGVRAVVIDGVGRVFLVRHSYVAGWHLPGGGVEAGETIAQSLARELLEEGGIKPSEPPRLHGVFFNARVSRRDHVAVYVVRAFTQVGGPRHRTRSSSTDSSLPMRCPRARRAAPARGSPRCSMGRRCQPIGE